MFPQIDYFKTNLVCGTISHVPRVLQNAILKASTSIEHWTRYNHCWFRHPSNISPYLQWVQLFLALDKTYERRIYHHYLHFASNNNIFTCRSSEKNHFFEQTATRTCKKTFMEQTSWLHVHRNTCKDVDVVCLEDGTLAWYDQGTEGIALLIFYLRFIPPSP